MTIASYRVADASRRRGRLGGAPASWPDAPREPLPLVAGLAPQGAHDLVGVLEAERGRIARDLHDVVAQALAALRFAVERAIPAGDERAAARLLEALAGVDDAILQVRGLAFRLHPPSLESGGLSVALRDLVDRQARAADLETDVQVDGRLQRLPADIETACYRIVQEAMTNVVKHAAARHVLVELRLADGGLHLVVRDDGRGTVPRGAGGGGGPRTGGIAGMAQRAAAVGGTLRVRSRPGAGTEVAAWLPCRGAVADAAG